MNIADIFDEIINRNLRAHFHRLPKDQWSKGEWQVHIEYTNFQGDVLKVERKNLDFESALIAAYEALRVGMNDGVALRLAAPSDIQL